MQEVMMSPTSDTTWDITPPSQEQLFNKIGEAIESKNQSINLRLTYTFNRKNPPGNQEVSHSIAIDVTKLSNNQTILTELYEATNPNFECTEEAKSFNFTVSGMYSPVIQLYESGDPEVIDDPSFHTDVTVSKSCRKVDDTSKNYWEITQGKISIDKTGISAGSQGLIFITYSEKITPSYLGNYSIIGFYTIIVYAVGTILRKGIQGESHKAFIREMPNPDSLLLLCEGILISRLENKIEREEELYFILTDVIRSPEVIKMITGSSIKKKMD